MSDTKQLDEQLAEFTDRLLSNDHVVAPDELQEEAQLLRALKTVIEPQEGINPAFQQRLTRTLEKEWHVSHRRRAWWRNLRMDRTPPRQLVAVATVLMVVMLMVLISIPGGGLTGGETVGTAAGEASFSLTSPVMIGSGMLAIAGIAFLIWRNRK